ncbi:MAG: Rid family hydrolase [Chromatocurvus sp.]
MSARWRVLAAAAFVASGALLAQDEDAAGRAYGVPVPGEFLVCTTCHGVDLAGNPALGAPHLAGLPAWYVRDQLHAFRRGWRGVHPDDAYGAVMRPQALSLDNDAAVARAGVYVAGLAAPAGVRSHRDLTPAKRGALLYRSCAGCHGAGGEGNEALRAPPLGGFGEDYLVRQLNLFRTGARGFHADDTSGAAMRQAATPLVDEAAVYDVVAYILWGQVPMGPDPGMHSKQTEEPSMQKTSRSSLATLAGSTALAMAVTTSVGASAEVRRHKLPDSDFPIAQAVEVLPGTTLVYHSGMTPRPANADAEQYSAEYWGDTEAQALSVFGRLQESLTAKGLTFGDVIKMQVFLVAPEAGGMMDFAGMMRAYRRYFGTEDQPNLPARSALQVAGLAVPGMLVEIEVVLARP